MSRSFDAMDALKDQWSSECRGHHHAVLHAGLKHNILWPWLLSSYLAYALASSRVSTAAAEGPPREQHAPHIWASPGQPEAALRSNIKMNVAANDDCIETRSLSTAEASTKPRADSQDSRPASSHSSNRFAGQRLIPESSIKCCSTWASLKRFLGLSSGAPAVSVCI